MFRTPPPTGAKPTPPPENRWQHALDAFVHSPWQLWLAFLAPAILIALVILARQSVVPHDSASRVDAWKRYRDAHCQIIPQTAAAPANGTVEMRCADGQRYRTSRVDVPPITWQAPTEATN